MLKKTGTGFVLFTPYRAGSPVRKGGEEGVVDVVKQSAPKPRPAGRGTGFACLAGVAGGVLFLFSLSVQSKEEKELIIGISPNPMVTATSLAGKGTADFREIFQEGADEFKKKYGYTMTLKFYPAPKFLFKAIQDKIVDFALMPVPVLLLSRNLKVPVKPLFAFNTTGIKGEQACVYVNRNSGIKSLKHLLGKTFAAEIPWFHSKKDALPFKESYIDWIIIRKIFLKQGINKPFRQFFKEFKVLAVPGESVAYSVLLDKFDAAVLIASYYQLLKIYDAGFSDLMKIECIDLPASGAVVYRLGVNPEVLKIIKEGSFSPQNKVRKRIEKEFKGIKSVSVQEKDYDEYFQWLEEADQKGWIEEFNEIIRRTPIPGKKTN